MKYSTTFHTCFLICNTKSQVGLFCNCQTSHYVERIGSVQFIEWLSPTWHERLDCLIVESLTCHNTSIAVSLPRDNLDPGDPSLVSEIDEQRRSIDVEIIEDGAGLRRDGRITVDSTWRVAACPLVADVSLQLPLVVNPRIFLVGDVLDCTGMIKNKCNW